MTPVNDRPFPAPRRPRETDADVIGSAATSFAATVAKDGSAYLDGASAEDFRQDLLDALPVIDDDGMELAQALNRRGAYPMDMAAAELMSGWPSELWQARDAAVKAWVAQSRPVPPFETLARVRSLGRRDFGEGVAYRTVRQDETAECLVVPDAERSRFTRDGAFAGGIVAAWENVEVVGDPTEADRTVYAAMRAFEEQLDRQRDYQALARENESAFAATIAAARAEILDMRDPDLSIYLQVASEQLGTEVDAGRFDPFGGAAARLTAGLRLAQERRLKKAFEALRHDPPLP